MVPLTRMAFALANLAAVFVLAMLVVSEQTQQQDRMPFVGVDAFGNIHINTTGTDTSVFINGHDIIQFMNAAQLLTREQVVKKPMAPALFLVGGSGSQVDLLSSAMSNAWTTSASTQIGRTEPALAVFQDQLCAIGGWAGSSPTASVECFDGSRWEYVASMGTARRDLAAAVYKGSMYAIGGLGESNSILNVVEAYNGSTWSTISPSLPTARFGLCAAVFNNLLYVVGGRGSSNSVQTVDIYDGDRWTSGQPMRTARAFFGLVIYDGLLHAVGGLVGPRTHLDTMETFDGVQWSDHTARLHTGRREFGCAVFQGNIFVVGGYISSSISSTEIFNGTSWRTGPSLASARRDLAAAVYPPEQDM